MAFNSYIQQMMGGGLLDAELTGGFIFLMILAAVWSLSWKGVALWKSAKKNQLVWFIVFLVVNTLGILEILYIFVFSNKNWGKKRK